MQVRHIENVQLDLAKADKTQLEPPPALIQAEGKPWEEVVECLALLAAVHMNPCQASRERAADEDPGPTRNQDQDDDEEQ